MAKSAINAAIAEEHGLKPKQVAQVLDSLATIGATQVKKAGIFAVPGLCRIKTRMKKATKASTRIMFGQKMKVKAKPARTVVKAFAVAALNSPAGRGSPTLGLPTTLQ